MSGGWGHKNRNRVDGGAKGTNGANGTARMSQCDPQFPRHLNDTPEDAMDALFVSGDTDQRVFERTGIPVE